MDSNGAKYVGPSFLTLLGLLFIGLKLMGYIDWPWWLVTLPIWGGIILGIVLLVVFFAFLVWCESRKRPW